MASKPSVSELQIRHNFRQTGLDMVALQKQVSASAGELETALKEAIDVTPETQAAIQAARAYDAQLKVIARSQGASIGQVKRAFADLAKEVKRAPSLAEDAALASTGFEDIAASADSATESTGGLADQLLGLVAPGAKADLDEIVSGVEDFAAASGASAASAGGLVLVLGSLVLAGGAAVAVMSQLYDRVVSVGLEQERVARLTGISTTTIGALGTMATIAGVGVEDLNDALLDLPEKLEQAKQGSGEVAEALGDLLVKGEPAEATLRRIFEHMENMDDASERTGFAVQVFGDQAGRAFSEIAASGVDLEEAIQFQSDFLQANQEVIGGFERVSLKLPAIKLAYDAVLVELFETLSGDLPVDTVFEKLETLVIDTAQALVTGGTLAIGVADSYVTLVGNQIGALKEAFDGLIDGLAIGMVSLEAALSGDFATARRLAADAADSFADVFIGDNLLQNAVDGVGDLADAWDAARAKGEAFGAGIESLLRNLEAGGEGYTPASKEAAKETKNLIKAIADLQDQLSGRLDAIGLDAISAEALKSQEAVGALRGDLAELEAPPALKAALAEQLDLALEQVEAVERAQRVDLARTDLAKITLDLETQRLTEAGRLTRAYEQQAQELEGIAGQLAGTAEEEAAQAAQAELRAQYLAERLALEAQASAEVLEITSSESELLALEYESRLAGLKGLYDDQLLSQAEYSQAAAALAQDLVLEVAQGNAEIVESTAGAIAGIAGDTAQTLQALAEATGESQSALATLARGAALIQIGASAAQAAASTFAGTTATLAPILGPAAVPIATVAAGAAGAATLSTAIPLLTQSSFARGTEDFRARSPDAGIAELHNGEGVVSRVGKTQISGEQIRAANRGESSGGQPINILFRGQVLDTMHYDATQRPGSPLARLGSRVTGRAT